MNTQSTTSNNTKEDDIKPMNEDLQQWLTAEAPEELTKKIKKHLIES